MNYTISHTIWSAGLIETVSKYRGNGVDESMFGYEILNKQYAKENSMQKKSKQKKDLL